MGLLARAALVALVLLTGCSGGESPDPPIATTGAAPPSPTATPSPTSTANGGSGAGLRDELLAMLERDQSARAGGPDDEGDVARTARLKAIIAEHGWPTISLVGEDAEDAAWAIAQHSDTDLAFQEQALELLRGAVERGDASPGNLAYLEDRVAVSKGRPQTYGTQIGCGPDGAVPATPIQDAAGVEQRRAKAGLDPLADYLAELTEACAQDPVP